MQSLAGLPSWTVSNTKLIIHRSLLAETVGRHSEHNSLEIRLLQTFMLHKLFENGKLRLDDQVQKHLPEFSVKNPFNNENITLR